ncbi:hypothetical protein NOF04DRAFT_6482 [Fusarium oxysporum II5]|uniref:Uncharacterized protein n=2 Tax=Fusarium oxysporum species complex TaxID=171631 RepID=X0JA92_FUSO5|nr:uncharacterized protein FOIG_09631 [Fusarium odoratissimum NRRL 54006]EXL98072.1 hypothetical protein FOIG_09631 [Fusarium odoratissimum NRRL 54006]KAK2124232.1 hypothetical protein NOF04DRAFT_6482 [Fusarium oxysporum II5]TXB96367.1 hypothetical protein FocTR4_00016700 [Fusarium oxysporum f. sp. cubense]
MAMLINPQHHLLRRTPLQMKLMQLHLPEDLPLPEPSTANPFQVTAFSNTCLMHTPMTGMRLLCRCHLAWATPTKCALDAFGAVKVAGYEVLGWRPYREETSPFMDRAGNTLPIRERPPLKSPEKRGDTVKDSTISGLRKQNLELKKRLKQQEIEKLPLCMRRSNEVQHLYKAASRSTDQLRRSRWTVLENVKELGFIHKKVKDREVTYNLGEKDQHPAEKHAAGNTKKPK